MVKTPLGRLALAALLAMGAAADQNPPAAPPACGDAPAGRWLDFWIGEWTVTAGGQHAGDNRIERAAGGCALLEHWQDRRGSTGVSLFFFSPASATWRQVWVTDRAAAPGGVKEKELVARYPDGSVRFQGAWRAGDAVVLDRTTLTPRPDGSVRQLIETSRDGGATWTAGFDAIYTPRRQP